MGRPESSSGRSLNDILAHAEGTHNTVVIAAIPAEDDYVWKISSEKVPHLTLLYLGEMEMGPKIAQIAEFLEHAASTSLNRFGLDVDHRGELGDDKADVLFFSKGWSTKHVEEFRSFLLNNQAIYEAYSSTTQFPTWTPHLTLGYPEAPAKPDDRDYSVGWVNFDRIALWVGDYEGPEFRLKNDYDMEVAMSSDTAEKGRQAIEKVLSHKGDKKADKETQLSDAAKKKLDVIADKYGEKLFTTPLMAYVKDLPESKQLRTMHSIVSDIEQLKVLLSRSSEDTVAHGFKKIWNEAEVVRDSAGQFASKASAAVNEKVDSMNDFGNWIDKNIYGVNADGTPINPDGYPLFDPVMNKLSEGGDWVDKNVYGVNADGSPIDPKGAPLFNPIVEKLSVFSVIPTAASQAYDYVTDKFKHSDQTTHLSMAERRIEVGKSFAHYGVKGMKWGVRRNLQKLQPTERAAYLKKKDAKWMAKVEADPKLGKISKKAARYSKRLTKKLNEDYKERGINLKKDPVQRSRYDSELKIILEQSLDKAAYKVHKYPPSRLNEVQIHRHPDGNITSYVARRHNAKLVKQEGKISRSDRRRVRRETRAAAKEEKRATAQHSAIMEDQFDEPDYLFLSFHISVDEQGYVADIAVPSDVEHNESFEDALAHYGIKGMKWGVRRSRAQIDAESEDSSEAKKLATIAKRSGPSALSNKELETLNKRLQLEQSFAKLAPAKQGRIKKGQKFTKEVLDVGGTVNDVMNFAKSPAGKAIAGMLVVKGGKHVKR